MNDTVPENIYVKDFMGSILKLFNLYVEVDNSNPKNLIIEPRDQFYGNNGLISPASTSQKLDWTSKYDVSKGMQIQLMSDLTARNYNFLFDSDNTDFYQKQYQEVYKGEIGLRTSYGDNQIIIDNDFVNSSLDTKVVFSPTMLDGSPVGGLEFGASGTSISGPPIYTSTPVISQIFQSTDANRSNFKALKSKPRLLYYAMSSTLTQWNHNSVGFTGGATAVAPWVPNLPPNTNQWYVYPYAGHLDKVGFPQFDLNFDQPAGFITYNNNVSALEGPLWPPNLNDLNQYTGNNLYNLFWKNYIEEITSPNNRHVTSNFYLTPEDIANFDFRNQICVDNVWYHVNKIGPYDVHLNDSTPVELIKAFDITPYGTAGTNQHSLPWKSENWTNNSNFQAVTNFSNVNTGVGNAISKMTSNVIVNSNYVTVGPNASGVIVNASDFSTVYGGVSNVHIINSPGSTVAASNVSLINSPNTVANISNTSYVNNVQTSGPGTPSIWSEGATGNVYLNGATASSFSVGLSSGNGLFITDNGGSSLGAHNSAPGMNAHVQGSHNYAVGESSFVGGNGIPNTFPGIPNSANNLGEFRMSSTPLSNSVYASSNFGFFGMALYESGPTSGYLQTNCYDSEIAGATPSNDSILINGAASSFGNLPLEFNVCSLEIDVSSNLFNSGTNTSGYKAWNTKVVVGTNYGLTSSTYPNGTPYFVGGTPSFSVVAQDPEMDAVKMSLGLTGVSGPYNNYVGLTIFQSTPAGMTAYSNFNYAASIVYKATQ